MLFGRYGYDALLRIDQFGKLQPSSGVRSFGQMNDMGLGAKFPKRNRRRDNLVVVAKEVGLLNLFKIRPIPGQIQGLVQQGQLVMTAPGLMIQIAGDRDDFPYVQFFVRDGGQPGDLGSAGVADQCDRPPAGKCFQCF